MNSLYLAVAILLCSANSFAQSVHGVFRVVKGDISVISKAGVETKAKIGQKVFPSDKIKAGKDSRAKVVMIDKNEINISPDTELVIENYQYKPEENKKNVLINVLYGKVRAKVEQKYDTGENKFQIKTPTAVAGVRGTDFITGYDSSTKVSNVVTFRGKVEFGLPGANGAILNPVFVTPGLQTSIMGSKPPAPPVAVPKAELAGMDKSSDAEKGPAGPAVAGGTGSGDKKGSGPKDGAREPSSTGGGTLKNDDMPGGDSKPIPPPVPSTIGSGGGDGNIKKFDLHTPIVNPDIIQSGGAARKLNVIIRNGTNP